MSNYGEPLLDKDSNLIGYKLNDYEFASVTTYYNADYKLCNKVSIRGLDEINKPTQTEALDT